MTDIIKRATADGKIKKGFPINNIDDKQSADKINGLNPLIQKALNPERERGTLKGVDAFKKINEQNIKMYFTTVLYSGVTYENFLINHSYTVKYTI